MSLRQCITGRGYDIVARQLLRPGYKTKEYSSGTLRRIHILSAMVYLATACTFAVTTVLYNPDNIFGDNGLVSTPILSFQTRELQDNCETLVLLFDDAVIQDPGDTNRIVPTTTVKLPVIEAAYDSSTHAFKSTTATETSIEIHPNVTLSWSGDIPLCKNFLRPFYTHLSATLIYCNLYCGFAPLSSTAPNLTLVNGNPMVDGSLIFRNDKVGAPFEFEFGFYDILVPAQDSGLGEYYGIGLDAPIDVEAALDAACTTTTFGAVNLASLPPFACTVTQFRGWLEVVALAGSNAGLVYAIAIVAFGAAIAQPSEEEAAVKA